ncbi:MAG: serine/threonine-protein kinase, partial [Egibacteraceae bacterium]
MREPTDRPAPAPDGAGGDARGDAPPATLQDRYRFMHLIANGGMASVWRARDEELARDVAVKMLHDHLAEDDEFLERFRREAVAAAKLAHPHVVGIYDTGLDGRRAWLVMELIDGATLRDLMDEQGTLDVAHAARIGEQVARGLGFAHTQGLVHRDVKPANILLGDDGSVKVTDFGIAKVAGAGADLTGTGTVLGTAAYVAPEQIRSEPLDGTCDQYALGCVLYEALTGRRPFGGTTAVETAARRLTDDPAPLCSVRPDLPAALGAVIERALAREATDRFPTAEDLADALASFAGHPDDPAPPGRRPAA